MLVDENYKKRITENLIFTDGYDANIRVLLDNTKDVNDFDIDVRDRYNAVSLKIDDMNTEKTEETVERELDKLIRKLNLEVFQKKRQEFLDSEEHGKYMELLTLAKKHNLK